MTVMTRSKFYYGYVVDLNNQNIPFDEGSGELNAEISIGTYSLSDFITQVEAGLNSAGTQLYTVAVDRTTRIITISAPGNFDLLFATGAQGGQSLYALLGYEFLDYTLINTYEAPNVTGKEFRPQFKLQNFRDFKDRRDATFAVVNESASGVVEVVSYGKKNTMRCNITFITDNSMGNNAPIENDQSGVDNAREFLEFIIDKGNVEFIPDRDNAAVFTKCFVTKGVTGDGTAFELKEMFSKKLTGYFETGNLEFREV